MCRTSFKVYETFDNNEWRFLSYFDNVYESEAAINNTSLKHLLLNNHEIAANKGEMKGQLLLEHISGFSKTFQKSIEHLGFDLTLKQLIHKISITQQELKILQKK